MQNSQEHGRRYSQDDGRISMWKTESEQKPSYLSSCCVVLTGEMTRLIEEKELIVSGTF